MLADILEIKDLEVKDTDLRKGEHLTPEYLKINPHHSIPALVDEDLTLTESRAILAYLVNKYSPDNSLYPLDFKKRAKIDQALYFDGSSLWAAFGVMVLPTLKLGMKFNPELAQLVDDRLNLLDNDLSKTQFLAGDELTIADLSTLASYTTIEAIGLNKTDHLTNIHNWVKRIKDTGKIKNYDDLVVKTAKICGEFLSEKLKGN